MRREITPGIWTFKGNAAKQAIIDATNKYEGYLQSSEIKQLHESVGRLTDLDWLDAELIIEHKRIEKVTAGQEDALNQKLSDLDYVELYLSQATVDSLLYVWGSCTLGWQRWWSCRAWRDAVKMALNFILETYVLKKGWLVSLW